MFAKIPMTCYGKCERLEEELKNKPKALTSQIFKLEREVSRLRSNIMRLYDEQKPLVIDMFSQTYLMTTMENGLYR